MKIKLSILLFLLMVLKTYASTAFFPKTINVWNSKEQAKIIGNCENQDKGSSDNSLPRESVVSSHKLVLNMNLQLNQK
ncbi:hypothetical protein PGH42_17155 [Legionella pneumophila]|nr:hypothetical protein PGH42_17155 [Legionella pneumophila]